jgi:hypothetical protein
MNKLPLLLWTVALLTAVALATSPIGAQLVSPIDTFMVLDSTAMPGEIVPMSFYVANDSVNLAGIAAYFMIDQDLLEWVGSWDSSGTPPTYLIRHDTLPRADIPGLFEPFLPLSIILNTSSTGTEFAAMAGAGLYAAIPQGRGVLYRLYVRVRESVSPGTIAQVGPFNPVDQPPHDDLRRCEYGSMDGLTTVFPTLVAGDLEIAPIAYGDCFRDGLVNVSDCIYLITFIFGGGPAPNPLALGDVDCNAIVNVSDVVYLLEFVFENGPAPGADCRHH